MLTTHPDSSKAGDRPNLFLSRRSSVMAWLATAYAKAGFHEKAEAILDRVEEISGDLGLFAEGVDPRTGSFLGNSPLLFSHVEYIRAVLELGETRRR